MIKVIGAKRLLLLAVLLGVNVLLAAATYFYLIPQESETEKGFVRSVVKTKPSRPILIGCKLSLSSSGSSRTSLMRSRRTVF